MQLLQKSGAGLTTSREHQDENQLGVSAGTIFGIKKMQFNSLDFGTIVISSYGSKH